MWIKSDQCSCGTKLSKPEYLPVCNACMQEAAKVAKRLTAEAEQETKEIIARMNAQRDSSFLKKREELKWTGGDWVMYLGGLISGLFLGMLIGMMIGIKMEVNNGQGTGVQGVSGTEISRPEKEDAH